MMGSFLTRGLILALGYAYPAYECYKTVDKNKPDIEKLRFWCQYWILVAVLTVFERVGDAFISWLPMYSEAKLAFYIYLWYPKTRGTTYVYDTFFQPYVAKHETEIDRNLLELRTKAGDVAVLYMQKVAAYGQTRFLEILQYVASQSQPTRTQPVQQRQQPQPQQVRRPAAPPPPIASARQPAAVPPPPGPQRASSLPTSLAKGPTREPALEKAASSPAASTTTPSQAPAIPTTSSKPTAETSGTSKPAEKATTDSSMEVEQEDSVSKEDPKPTNPNPNTAQEGKETVMEETIRVTRGRLRKTRSTAPNR